MFEPASKNISNYEAGHYYVTAASWDSPVTGLSYEIGIREKKTGKFTLLQSEKYNHKSAMTYRRATKALAAFDRLKGSL